jgi:hypothetical protein
MSFFAGGSIRPDDYDASTPGPAILLLVVIGVVVVVAFVFVILYVVPAKFLGSVRMPMKKSYLVKPPRSYGQPQRDLENSKGTPWETIGLQRLNDANPSQKYKQVKGLKRQAAWASTQSSSAEVWYVASGSGSPDNIDIAVVQSASKR